MLIFPKLLLLFTTAYLAISSQASEQWLNGYEEWIGMDWYNEFENPSAESIGIVTPMDGPSPDILISGFARRRKRAIEGLDYEIALDCQRIKSNNDKRVTSG